MIMQQSDSLFTIGLFHLFLEGRNASFFDVKALREDLDKFDTGTTAYYFLQKRHYCIFMFGTQTIS